MKKLGRILIPTDFSLFSQAATEVGISLAKKFDSALTFLHVVIPAPYSSPSEGALKQRAEERFKMLGERLEHEEVTVDKFMVMLGKPVNEILKVAEQNNVNVIIMGACGSEKPLIAGLGGTTEGVIRKSDQPVLTVRPPAKEIFEHILAPVDFSGASARALKNAIRLTRAFGSQLTILHVVENVKDYISDTDDEQGMQQQWEKEDNARFDKFLEQVDLHDLEWKRMLRTGKPHEEIEKAAREIHGDLIVMGARGQAGVIQEFLLGTTATKVCRILPASLLTVKEEDILRVPLEEDIKDTETLYKKGLELLKDGLLEDAISHFEHLLKHDMHFASAWDAVAEAYERLKQPEEAEICRERAELIRQRLWAHKVQAEIRGRRLI